MSSSLSRFSGWRLRSLSLGEGLTDSTGAPGWHPRCWCVGSRAAPAFFFLALWPSSYRVDRGRHLASSTFAGVLNVELSLPIFRLALAVFIPWRGADGFDRRAGWHPRCWCVGSRAAPAFFFLALWPSSYRVDRGRHLASSTFAGVLNVELSLPIFRLALAVFIPWRGADGFDRRAGMAPALLVCWIAGGAGFFLFSVVAVELPGRSRPAPGVVDLRRGTQCRALSPDFPAGACGLYPLARG